MTEATKKECRLYGQESDIHRKLAVTESSTLFIFFSVDAYSSFLPQSLLFSFSLQRCRKNWRTMFEWALRRRLGKKKVSELVPPTAEDLKDLNVNQILGHLNSTKTKEASKGIQQCILEGMYMSSKCDRIKSDKELQKILKKNLIPYARTRRSQLVRLYWWLRSFLCLKKLDTGLGPSEILNKLSVIKAV